MKKYFIHNAFFRLLAPPVYGVLIYLLILLINNSLTQVEEFFSGQEVYMCIGLTFICFESARLVIALLNKFLKGKYAQARILIQLIAGTALPTILVTLAISLYFTAVLGFSIPTYQLILFGIIFGFTAVLYNLLYVSNDYQLRENTLKLTAERQQREVLEMEMDEFRNDINPDLLSEVTNVAFPDDRTSGPGPRIDALGKQSSVDPRSIAETKCPTLKTFEGRGRHSNETVMPILRMVIAAEDTNNRGHLPDWGTSDA
jgi:hypothetical protein